VAQDPSDPDDPDDPGLGFDPDPDDNLPDDTPNVTRTRPPEGDTLRGIYRVAIMWHNLARNSSKHFLRKQSTVEVYSLGRWTKIQ
jgi:hypothetical protein